MHILITCNINYALKYKENLNVDKFEVILGVKYDSLSHLLISEIHWPQTLYVCNRTLQSFSIT